MSSFDYDIIVIGAGSAGLAVARKAATLGFKVAVAEKGISEGFRPTYGFTPDKTILQTIRLATSFKKFGAGPTDLKKIMDEVDRNIGIADSLESLPQQGIEVLQGFSSFVDGHTIDVDREKYTAKKICIAAGSKPAAPPIEGLKDIIYQTNETIFSMERMPASMIVLGTTAIGLELSQVFARFGCKVTIIENSNRLQPEYDAEIEPIIVKALADDGIDLLTNANVKKISEQDGKKLALVEQSGQSKEIMAEEILVAAGNIPHVAGLDLELSRVEYSKNGIKVNDCLQTTSPNIWACGGVVGPLRSTYMAAHQADVVIANMVYRFPKRVNYDYIPTITLTDPQMISFGLTQEAAKQKGIKFEAIKLGSNDLDEMICDESKISFLKLLVSKGEIVGAVCAGTNAIHLYPLLAKGKVKTLNKILEQRSPRPFTKKFAKFMFNLFT